MATGLNIDRRPRDRGQARRLVKRLLAIFSTWLIFTPAAAQLPPPINLGIVNLAQEGPAWGWASVARQIIAWKNHDLINAPQQCALVAMANGAPPETCCSGVNPACNIGGSNQQIQMLIASFSASYAFLAPPAQPMVLYNTLQSARPIILQIATGPSTANVVVLQGMEWYQTAAGPRAMLLINDPRNIYPALVPFESIAPIWMSAIVVN